MLILGPAASPTMSAVTGYRRGWTAARPGWTAARLGWTAARLGWTAGRPGWVGVRYVRTEPQRKPGRCAFLASVAMRRQGHLKLQRAPGRRQSWSRLRW